MKKVIIILIESVATIIGWEIGKRLFWRGKKMVWIAYAAAWISTAAAVVAGVHVTGSAWCLWAMALPLLVTIKESKKDGGEEE